MTSVLRARRLTKIYGRRPGLTDADLDIPAGRVVGLVGPNGAGKSTLLGLSCGLIEPSAGSIEVLGERPGTRAAQLARVGFVAQDTPLYPGLTVAEHLRLGARLNPGWDDKLARRRVQQIGLDLAQRAGRLSGGQRAQLALTIAVAKRPELLIFDEPVAALDPLARWQFLQNLMEFVSELAVTVVLSSHLLGDVERVCDHLVLLSASRVRLSGAVDDLVDEHFRVVVGREDLDRLPSGAEVVHAEHKGGQSTLVVRRTGPAFLPHAERINLEDMVLAYMTGVQR
ncbi:ABC transporter ATP-binding protein [Plantactinospora sp. S1510]|uniref:ABC transporter ATP-binding protein n=1 Tax=Plantactinospora alkalitolerans TaxID=2789879 RepID=A0ABS0HAH7_9ACTN|nr:ABC transporter ATP-binding protein [Plantactinospora alkalitolerans]MBF9135467.1 ABC transporter ATP-binding protein [Plantactinospora alkalitolerans]